MNKEIAMYEGKRTLGSIVGAFLYAAGINLFVVPTGLYTGGVMGICQVIRTVLSRFFGLQFDTFDIAGVIYYAVNLPIFIVAFRRMGRKFFTKTVITVTAMTVFLSLIPTVTIVSDRMAACVVGGIIAGAGTGITLRMGASGGGMDVIGVVLTKWKQDFSVGRVNLFVNLALYAACLFLFDIEVVVFCIIYSSVYSIAMDRVHTQNINVEATVITKADTAALEKEVFEELGRGITKWSALGAYTYERSHVLYIMLSKYEVHRLRTIIFKYDPSAFIVFNEGVTVSGHFLKKL